MVVRLYKKEISGLVEAGSKGKAGRSHSLRSLFIGNANKNPSRIIPLHNLNGIPKERR
jgi:hypothetical protein